jgi:BASS family bile acid:Na+ symporter
MIVRRLWPRFARGMDRPVRVISVIVLVIVIAGAVAANWALLVENAGRLALITIVFCVLSLSVGYLVPRLVRVGRRQAIASSFEIGIHNATLAIVIAQTVLGSVELSLPAAVYGVLMFFIAFGFGFLIRGRQDAPDTDGTEATAASTTGERA